MANLNKTKSKKKEDKKKKPRPEWQNKAIGTGQIVGAGLTAGSAISSGVPRILGVRLEQHSTSRKKAKDILKTGYLDPNYGGTGASKAIANDKYINNSKGYVHVTGYHPDSKFLKGNNPVSNILARKLQKGLYRGMADVNIPKDISNSEKMQTIFRNIPLGILGIKGRTLYTPGTDEYFNKEFIPDEDTAALKSNKKVRVYGSKLGATIGYLKEKGLKSIPKNMLSNKGRVGAGLAILGVGGTMAGLQVNKGIKTFMGKPENSRKNKVYVKSYLKKGKIVKSYSRKNKR